ncbi:hypothetical protein ACFPIJ_32610 [Dactylosporangium cerinum]|uniref:Lipoprotein n=1 Tax=Dactylosporangium cerinum TaxID=1434730 RepID=A0ABV9W1N2_9ACTN
MNLRMLAVAGTTLTALIALAGCGGDDPPTDPTGNGATSMLEAAKCMREHGYPDYPDPVRFDDGRWGFPDSAPDVDPPEACRRLFIRGKNEQAPKPDANPAYLAQARKFAECMRTHGAPGWPDPDSDGYYDPPAALLEKNNADVHQAHAACDSQQPPGGALMKPLAE